MNKNPNLIIAASLVLCGGTASAQTSVTMYGVVDVGVEHVRNTAPSGASLTRIPGLSGSVPSRLGFRGTEDLGGGFAANFALEMGFAPDSGSLNQGGRAFGRQSWVGLSSPYGSVALGRQYTMLFWSLLDSDVIGPHMQSMANFDSYLPNAREDNSFSYRGKFSDFSIGATYSLGRDVVNAGPSPSGTNCPGESATDKQACRAWSTMLKYDASNWGAAFGVDEIRGGPGAFAGLTSSAMKDRRSTLNGYVRLGAVKVGGGLIRRNNGASAATPRSDLWYLGASYPVAGQWVVDAQWSRYDLKASPNEADLLVLRATYALSKRTAVYASIAHISNKGTATFSAGGGQAGGSPAAGESQSALGAGIRHSF